ncbi:MAG: DUF3499 domain-containing protein [Mycobacteriales bacterium]
MMVRRRCSRTGCAHPAVATLTYVYSDSTAVVGPLATYAEPHSYDLCAMHARSLTAPRGWEVMRYAGEFVDPFPTGDDLEALADAVREAARPAPRFTDPPLDGPAHDEGSASPGGKHPARGRRGHLRVVRDPD